MIIEKIKLTNFRNYKSLSLSFEKGINVFYGNNGSGKTNLAEAIYFISLTKSFRTSNELELINNESNDFALINSSIEKGRNFKKIDIYISKDGKKISIDNKNINRISLLSQEVNIIYFLPRDVNLFKESPRVRRNFFNIALSKQFSEYLKLLNDYEKVLKMRNEILKEENPNITLLDVYAEQLIAYSFKIYKYRKEYFNKINIFLPEIYQKISLKKSLIKLVYLPFVDDLSNYKDIALNKYKNALESDLKTKRTTIGIHLEDFYILLDNKNITLYGSQGENRMAVLSLKLVPYFLINEKENKPIVILDDVLSELDENNKLNLLNFLKVFEQVFITTTNKITMENITNFLVLNNNVSKEGSYEGR